MESNKTVAYENDLNLKDTELRLGLPGTTTTEEKDEQQAIPRYNKKRPLPEDQTSEKCSSKGSKNDDHDDNNTSHSDSDSDSAPPSKAKIVGWPPIRSYRKNSMKQETECGGVNGNGMYVKVSMDGAPYLRKIDLKVYNGYSQLLKALQNMFKLTIGQYNEREGYKGSEYAPTYEDKDGDWMLVGDVPWDMFMTSCKRLRIMKGSEARGLGCGV